MTIDPRLILAGVGLLLLAIVLLKFGKMIARVLLIAAVLALAIVLALALLNQATATRKMTAVAQVASVGAAGASIGTVIMSVLLLVSVSATGVFWIRWKLAERRQLPRPERRRRPAQPEREERESLYYYEDDDAGIVDVFELDLDRWGW